MFPKLGPAKPAHESAQAICDALKAQSQDHFQRIEEMMQARHRAVLAEMTSSLNPPRVVQWDILDAAATELRRRIHLSSGIVGSIFVENLSVAANANVFLTMNITDPVTLMGPPPYMTVAPGHYKHWPVNPLSQVTMVSVLLDAASTGFVRIMLDTAATSRSQGVA